MAIHINSDKEKFRADKPKLIGDSELTVRGGTGANEKEILRTQLDTNTGLPRVGINRTGQRVNEVKIISGGSGYVSAPTVTIGAPTTGVQAQCSAFVFNGQVVSIAINEPGNGYTQAPSVTLSGGGGAGATAEALLDTVDYELDINGAIRTSTSIISDTARILNLAIDNFVTPNAAFRAPSLKNFANNSGTLWSPNIILQENAYRYFGQNIYQALNSGQTGNSAPTHTDGIAVNGEVQFKHIGFRVVDQNAYGYSTTPESGEFPRSITPLLGDRSDRIATTEYVLNLATNDVGGRIYVSQQIGSDLNDGRSAVNPVRTIKKAAQLAWSTPGVKETLIVSGGDYVEDNPISLPPDASVVGDNLRLVIIRPANPGKHIFKFGDKNYVIGVTYRDKIDSNGDPVATWDFAMVFDDKQRVLIDKEANGDFGTSWPIGHQIFGPDQFRVCFQNNTGLSTLVTGLQVVGVNTGARATISNVTFNATTGASAYIDGTIDITLDSGSFVEGEQFNYVTSVQTGAQQSLTTSGTTAANKITYTTDPTSVIPPATYVYLSDVGNATFTPSAGYYQVATITPNDQNSPTAWEVSFVPLLGATGWTTVATASIETFLGNAQVETLNSSSLKSIRAEGEVVSVDEDYITSLPISRIDFSLQGDPSIATGGFQNDQFGNAEDLGGIVFYTNALVGRNNTHEFKEGQEILIEGLSTGSPDLSMLNGKQRIYKVLEDADGRCRRFVIPKKLPALTNANYDPGQFAIVKSFTKSITLSLLNSPNSFPVSSPVDRRYQDAVTFIRNNREFIADEVLGIINSQFARLHYSVYDIGAGGGNDFKIFIGLAEQEHTYVSGGTVTFNGNTVNVTDFVYDNTVTGNATVTIASPLAGLAEDSTIKLENLTLSCDAGQKIYPAYSAPSASGSDGDVQCKQDVIHFLNALTRDLEFGTNFNIIDAAKKYIVGGKVTYIEDEIVENVRAVEYARQLAIHAMRNWRIENGTPSDPIYQPLHSSVTRYFDDTVITATAGSPACANVASAIDTLSFLWVDVITNNASGTYLDAAYLISRNKNLIADQALIDTEAAYPLLQLNDVNERKCRRDVRKVLDGLVKDLVLGGNDGILNAAESYFTGTALTGIQEAQRPATIYAFGRARLYAIAAMRNWTDGNTIEVTPTNSTYNSSSGELTVTFPNPTIPVNIGDRVAFKEDALNWSCTYNGTTANHPGPNETDPTYGKSFNIYNKVTTATDTIIYCNVGDAGAAAGVSHTFVSAISDGTIIIYNPTQLTSTIPKFEDWNILLDASAGAANTVLSPTNATYDGGTGLLELTVPSGHGVTTSNTVRIAENSITMTCGMDNNATEHSYPQVGQPAYGNNRPVTAVSTTTITVDVGQAGANTTFTPTNATYDPVSGLLVLTIGSHNLSLDEGIVIANDSLTFTCTMDGNQSQKTYPRAAVDYVSGRSIPIIATSDETISVNVGAAGANKTFTPSNAVYDPNTGDMILTLGAQHGLGVGRGITIADNSLVFTCAQDGNATNHPYPRPTDPASGTSRTITAVSESQHTVSSATYTPSTGVMVVTSNGHGFDNGDYVKFDDNSLTFTCSLDGNATNHTYPRATDRASGRWLLVSNKTNNTFEVNVGITAFGGTHAFVSATSNGLKRQTGTITVNVGTSSNVTNHTFVSAATDAIGYSPTSAHTFVSASTGAIIHQPSAAHTFKRMDSNSVSVYAAGAAPLCANVATSINTIMSLLEDVLDGTTAAGATTRTYGTLYDPALIYTYPDTFLYDEFNTRVTIRGDFDDFPIIEASPYTQNASVISFLGGGGALVDGSKVKQPNCPFPGLELDGTASFPNQGKSMVASAFTIVSFGGTGYKVIEDGYTQLVSVFVIFCQDGVLCETGGYASITNSATNFGTFALRGTGFRRECYEFDVGTVNVVSQTPTGRTTLTIGGIGREPLEHYIVKFDGYRNLDPEKEFFIDAVSGVTVGPPFSATITLDDGIGNGLTLIRESDNAQIQGLTALQQALTPSAAANATIKLHRPSIVNSSSHTWEFAGSGTNYLALPENGGTKVEANEQVSQDYGRVYVSGTDELGDFKVGTFARIENRTGNITFTGTVTISEVEFLKLKGGDVVVTGFDNSNTLGGANASDSKLPTQKAVKDYITNNLGPYINKPFSTNAVPRALVELTDSGKISLDQIPALRPFSVFTVADQAARLALEGALAGDIAIQQDTQTSFILNNDLTSLFLGFAVDSTLSFTIGDVFTGTPSTGRIQATEYRQGVLYKINITDGGSGYTVAPTVTISGGNPSSGAVAATATATIANGEVVTITINENAGYIGGYGFTTQPTITIAAPPGAGTQATATALIESRLYGNIVNNIKMLDTDTFDDSTSPSANTVNITRVINTSAFTASNWVSLSSDSVGVSSLTGPGVISTTLLGSEAANSFTFLRGDSRYAKVVQSLKGAETRYFARLYAQASTGASSFIFQGLSDVLKGHDIVASVGGIQADTSVNGVSVAGGLTTVSFNNPITSTISVGTVIEFNRGASPLIFDSTNTGGDFIDSIVIANPGTGYTDGQYFDVALDAPAGNNGVDLRANIIVGENGQAGQITTCTVTNAGSGYTSDFQVTPLPTVIGAGSNGVLLAKVATTQKQFANIALDVQRVSDLTISQDLYGTIGVARFKKSQFNIGDEGNGAVSIKMGPDSGLDADLLDGQQGAYYLNGAFFVDSSIVPDKLASGVYSIDISGRSTNTLRLDTGTSNANANPGPSDAVQGVTLQTLFNSSNGLLSAFPSVDTGNANSAKHLVMTLRNGETGGDATFGGVRQLAFANDDRIYFRGSGDAVTSYGSWYEVWNSGNQGVDSGLDADKLDNKQGAWYQDAKNIISNEIFDTRLPVWRSSSKFRDKIEIKSYTGTDVFYRILVRQNLDISVGGDFEVTNTIDLFDTNKISVGDFTITGTEQVVDQNDSANTYTILIGRLASGGNITQAVYLGVAGDERLFEQWEIYDANTTQYAELGNASGTGFLRLGRKDGNAATNPYIYFNSSQTAALYNSAIIADGGNATTGSGSLEFKVLNENELKVNNNIIWNAGNVAFNSANVPSTASLKSAVIRDTNGNFVAGTITAALTGAASENVLKSGDTMTGTLTMTGGAGVIIQSTGTLSVGSNTTVGGDLTVDTNTLYVDSTDNRVSIGHTDPQTSLHIKGDGWESNVVGSGLLRLEDTTSTGAAIALKNANGQYWNIYNGGSSSWAGQGNLGFVYSDGTNDPLDYKIAFTSGGDILPGDDSDQDIGTDGTRWQNIYSDITHALNSVRIAKGSANQEADIQLRGGGTGNGGGRGFRLGTNIGGGPDLFEIYASQTNGSDNWKSLANPAQPPALAIQGTNNRVGINTNSFSGTDTSTTPNTSRNYILNVQGDMNLNGQFFQNNEEFVTSRWTESSNDSGANIYRNSKVGIGNVPSPAYTLDVNGDVNMVGVMRVNGTAQWFDSYGVIRGSNNSIAETVTIPNNAIASSNGPITIVAGGGHVVTIGTGATWVVR